MLLFENLLYPKQSRAMTKKASYLPRGQRLLNDIFTRMVRLGLIPKGHLISVLGRKSGLMRTTPVFVLSYQGQRWLVAGFQQADWVKNLRTAGWCLLIHDRREERVTVIEETDPTLCAPLLQQFARRAPGSNRGPMPKPNAPLSEFLLAVPAHPVFRITEPVLIR